MGTPALTDRELLRDFVATRASGAFEELVRRHAGLVRAAALRILGDAHRADDVSQAVFLLLARKAAGQTGRGTLAGWLHRTAELTARAWRTREQRRERHEREAAAMRMSAASEEAGTGVEVGSRLDAALLRLPERQRTALILRYLEGQSEFEAARTQGCPVETLHSRVRSGLAKLRLVLARGGSSLPVAALVELLEGHAAPQASEQLVSSIHAACMGKAGATSTALGMAEAAMRTMFWVKVKTVVLLGAMGAVLLGAGLTLPRILGAAEEGAPAIATEAGAKAPEKRTQAVDLYGDPLPKGALARCGTVRYRPGEWVNRLRFVEGDKKLLCECSSRVQYWNPLNGKLEKRMEGVAEASADGKFIREGIGEAFKDEFGTCVLKEMLAGRVILNLHGLATKWSRFPTGAFSLDGSLYVIPCNDTKSLRLFRLPEGQELPSLVLPHPLPGGSYFDPSFVISRDGTSLAVQVKQEGTNDVPDGKDYVCIWTDLSQKEPARMLEDFSAPIAFSPDGSLVAACHQYPQWRHKGSQPSVVVTDVKTGREARRLPIAAQTIGNLVFARSSEQLGLTAGKGNIEEFKVQWWDLASGKLVWERVGGLGLLEGSPLAISSDGKHLAWIARSGILSVCEVGTGHLLSPLDGHSEKLKNVTFSQSGQAVMTATDDGVIRSWRTIDGGLLATDKQSREDRARSKFLFFAADGCSFFVACEKELRQLDFETGKLISTFGVGEDGMRDAPVGIGDKSIVDLRQGRLSTDGRSLVVFGDDYLQGLNTVDKKAVLKLNLPRLILGDKAKEYHSGHQLSAAFSEDGLFAAVHYEFAAGNHVYMGANSELSAIYLVSLKDKKIAHTLKGPSPNSMIFSPNGRLLAYGEWDRVGVVDVASGEEVAVIREGDGKG